MRVDCKLLETFLEKATMKYKINEVGLRFNEDGVVLRAMNANIAGSFSYLKKEAFNEYQKTDVLVGINNVDRLCKMLSTFSGVINIGIEDNMLNLWNNEGKTASMPLVTDSQFITGFCSEDIPLLSKFDGGVVVSKDIFKQVVKNISIVDGDDISIIIENNTLTMTVGNKDKGCSMKEVVKADYKNVKSLFGDIILDCFNVIDNTANISLLQDDGPIMISIREPNYGIKLLVVPLVKEREDDKNEQSTDGEVQAEQV